MNSNGIIIALLTVLVMVGVYLIMDKKTAAPTVIRETVREIPRATPAADGSSVEFKLNRKIKL